MAPNPQVEPAISLRDYIRRDFARASGIDREMLTELDTKPKSDWSSAHKKWGADADRAENAAIDWIIGNAPEAVQHLRAAGLYIPDVYDLKEAR